MEATSDFYVRTSESAESIELVENYEMTNEFKQQVCLPYFKDIHKVVLSLTLGHVLPL